MPWLESNQMDERLKFVAKLLDGEKMTVVCREFGISRKTGYKIFNRYKDSGLDGLKNQSRRPYHHASKLPFQIERTILRIKKEYKSWGAFKIRARLIRLYPQVKPPATSTVHAVLDRHGLVTRRGRKRYKSHGTHLRETKQPNGLWCADYKGEFKLGNQKCCYPLTITDYPTRYLLACEGLESTRSIFAFDVFERVFKEFGVPSAIRTDNGVPFAAPNSFHGLSRLSLWWLRLGIDIERIKPGNPQQNGRHERMHLTLKKEATKPPGFNFLQQQSMFDDFIEQFNNDRPHQALNMKYPGELYTPSVKVYQPPEDPDYPLHDKTIQVTQCGRICLHGKKISFSRVFAGQLVGIREVDDKIWLVSFLDFDLGYFDEDGCRVEPIDNPFMAKVLPMSSVKGVTHVSG
jgi:putative transposase